jgi:hypothetical protein
MDKQENVVPLPVNEYIYSSSKSKNKVLRWGFTLNRVAAAAGNCI